MTYPTGMRDAERDPFPYCRTAEAEAANEEFIRAMADNGMRTTPADRWIYVIASFVVVALLAGWLR